MSTPPLEQAPPATQLAVELILLLEQSDIDCDTALQAIAIVQRDLLRKQQQQDAANVT